MNRHEPRLEVELKKKGLEKRKRKKLEGKKKVAKTLAWVCKVSSLQVHPGSTLRSFIKKVGLKSEIVREFIAWTPPQDRSIDELHNQL